MIPVPGVYMIRNNTTQCVYVGSSHNVQRRCREHRQQLIYGRHPVSGLQQDWLRFGPESFTFTLLEPTTDDNDRLGLREHDWQKRLRQIGVTLYGLQDGGRTAADWRVRQLRWLRLQAALTQEQLAARAGVQRLTITRLELGGEARPSTVRKLATALHCTPADLIGPES